MAVDEKLMKAAADAISTLKSRNAELESENVALRKALTEALGEAAGPTGIQTALAAQMKHPGGPAKNLMPLLGDALEQHKLRKARETVARSRPADADPHQRGVKRLGEEIQKARGGVRPVTTDELRRRAGLR